MRSVLLTVGLFVAVLAILFGCEQLASDLLDNGIDAPVTLHADKNGHFFGNLTINGTSLKYIVDSGASNVTLNSSDANKAKIDYIKGDVVGLVTPGGELQAFSLKLDGLTIGTTVLDDVEVTVVEGDSPPYVLLGVSVQRKLDVKRDNTVMTLGRRQ